MGTIFLHIFSLPQVKHNYPSPEAQKIIWTYINSAFIGFITFWAGAILGELLGLLGKKCLPRIVKPAELTGWRSNLLLIRFILYFIGAITVGIGALISFKGHYSSPGRMVIGIGLLPTVIGSLLGFFSPSLPAKKKS